jgi:hypothetical protein
VHDRCATKAGGDAQIALIWHHPRARPLSGASAGIIDWTAGGSLVTAVVERRLAAASRWMKTSPARRPRPPGVRFRIHNEQGWIASTACATTADWGVAGSRGWKPVRLAG